MLRIERRVLVRVGIAFAAVGVLIGLAMSPVGKPADIVRTHYLSRDFSVKRQFIGTASNRRGLPHRPRFVAIRTDGPKIRVYLLDLSQVSGERKQVEAFMAASAVIGQGLEPTPDAVVGRAIGVTEARFDLHRWPWGLSSNFMVIVAADGDAEVTVRVSYGQ